MALTTDEKRAIIAYRMEKSRQTMIEARDETLESGSESSVLFIVPYGFGFVGR